MQSLSSQSYIGRFAPSPTGPLHAGSLYAALGSYLDAKANHGQWLLRIEDVDTLRNVEGASEAIIESLRSHGLHWDGEAHYQANNNRYYQTGLDQLAIKDSIFYCNCTRAKLRALGGPYPGFCRLQKKVMYTDATKNKPASHAIRLACGRQKYHMNDRVLGPQIFDMKVLGDCILKRRDSLFAYQLAVVMDDAAHGITHVVRGADLLESSAWQIALQHSLDFPLLDYAHLPVITLANSEQKLSKQTGAAALDNTCARENLLQALQQLRQPLPFDAEQLPIETLLIWAIEHWNIEHLRMGKNN
tara:strand:+ start:1176 stop:2081 length:906 start_codon:yes stop_codon:yes gene_type:complete